jgi:magnesium-transporting ATPase (P-type)
MAAWWHRWGPLAGALGVVCFIVSIVMYGNGPHDDDRQIVAYFEKGSNQTKYIVAFYFFFAAFLLMLVFLSSLRAVLVEAEGAPGRLTALAFAGGLASAVLLLAANALFAAPAITEKDSKKFVLDPNTYRFINDTGYVFFITGVMAAVLMVVATSLIALRTGVFPRWFAWIGFLVAVTLVVAFFFVPVFILWGWILVTSGYMLLSARQPARPITTGP